MSIIVSSDLAAAIEASERTPLVRIAVDWDMDGYGAPGSIDDLSGKQGAVKVDRVLTTDLPAAVRIPEGSSSATGTVDLAEGDVTDESMHAARYWTRGSDGPLAGKERNGRPCTVDIGMVTAAGPQYVRRLTGYTRRMVTKARGRTAAMDVIDNRAKMRAPVTLIPTNGPDAGCNGTWLVFQALYANDVRCGPVPRASGSLLWVPGYGSIQSVRSDRNPGWTAYFDNGTFGPNGESAPPAFIPGPFVLAPNAYVNGAAGLQLTGAAGGYASTPSAAPLNITGDIDLRVDVRPNSWTPANNSALIGKWNDSGNQRGYLFWIDPAGTLRLLWSTTGADFPNVGSTVPVTPPTTGRLAVRATLAVGTGTVTFYTAPTINGPWTQLGSPGVAGATSIFATSVEAAVGAYNGGSAGVLAGTIYAAEIHSGIGNPFFVTAPDFTILSAGTTSFQDAAGRTWTVNGSAAVVAAGAFLRPLVGANPSPGTVWNGRNTRVEFWTLGVADTSPPNTNSFGRCHLEWLQSGGGQYGYTALGVNHTGHPHALQTDENIVPVADVVSNLRVPADGAWHFVGVHLDVDAALVTFVVDGQTETLASTLPTNKMTPAPDEVALSLNAPTSDIHGHAVPAATPWLNQGPIRIDAVLDQSLLELVASYEGLPQDPWQLLAELANSEQALAAYDEAGVYRYRTRARLADVAGQTVQRVLTTDDASLLDVDIDDGQDQVRNIVQVAYTPVTKITNYGNVFVDDTHRAVGPFSTLTYVVSLNPSPVLSLTTVAFSHNVFFWDNFGPPIGNGQILDPIIACTTHSDFTNDSADPGGGFEPLYDGKLTCAVTQWTAGTATIVVTNNNPVTIYIAHLSLSGTAAIIGNQRVVEARSADSIGRYGPQLLQLTMPQWVQSDGMAGSLAQALLGDLKDPHPQVSGLRIVGDPRRQLGDRVEIADPSGTRLDGEFWLTQITDQVTAVGDYTQTIAARAATRVARYAIGRYGVDTYG